ncbi:MAG: helix-turn-helix domain-containing protein [Bacteroidetes bacterium]|nr:helix-turn-helix domain-containing protein [Bacteroidota bacterium]
MLLTTALKFYDSQSNLARALKISKQAVQNWVSRGYKYVPELQAFKLEKITDGKLKHNGDFYK